MNATKDTLDIFTPFRGIMMLYIILGHFLAADLMNSFFILPMIISKAHLGADFFFLLSSFLFLYQNHNNNLLIPKNYWYFLQKKILRIHSLHIIMTLFFLIVFYKGHYYSLTILASNLTLTHTWLKPDEYGYMSFTWYLSAQFFLYLIMPLFGFIYNYSKSLMCFLTFCFFVIFGYIIFITQDTHNQYNSVHHITQYALLRAVTNMFFGGIAFWVYQILRNKNIKTNSIFIISVLCFVGYLTIQYLNPLLIPDVIIIPIFVSMIIGLLFITDSIKGFFMKKWLIFIGHISFPLLFTHQFFIGMFNTNIITVNNYNFIELTIVIILSIAISILFAYILDKYIDTPIQRYFANQ